MLSKSWRTIVSATLSVALLVVLFLSLACGAVAPSPAATESSLKPSSTVAGIRIVPAEIPVSDGNKLAADLYLPEKGGQFPVILIQTPYNKNLYNPILAKELAGTNAAAGATGTAFGGAGGSFIQSLDYAVVTVDWRGRFGSKSAAPLGGVGTAEQRRQDGYDTVEWIAKQVWCNGKVGTWGSSALGGAQFATAATQPPHLVCMEPRVADFSNSYGTYYFGGVMRKEYMDGLRLASWGALADIVAAHPLDDGFYDGKDTADAKDIKTPALLIGGWWDIHDMPRIYNALLTKGDKEAGRNFRMMICPSSHTLIARDGPEGELEFSNAGPYARNEQKKFFDYWLRGADGGFANSLPVTYFQMGSDEWRSASQWPPAGMKKVNFYLNDGGTLTSTPAAGNLSARQFVFDPKDPVPTAGGNVFQPGLERGPIDQSKKVEQHKDVLIFSSEVLTEDVAIDGEIEATLYVSSDSVDTDVAIRVTDVYPDGRSMIVRDGIQRLSHLEGDKAEKFITPGTVYPMSVRTYSVGQTFLKGHRIRLIVSASNYPRYGVNNGSQDRNAAPKTITDNLYFDTAHPSALVLPMMVK